MTRKPRTLAFWRGRLPHWEVEDGRYFVTIHLAGAIPETGQQRLRQLSEAARSATNSDEVALRHSRLVFAELEAWLDRSEHACLLRQPEVAQVACEAIEYRDGRDWGMIQHVVMPNHVHLFFELGRDRDLRTVLRSFKQWTTVRANDVLGTPGQAFWQREWFDHWSRSDEEDDRIVRYIRNNPVKGRLVNDPAEWAFASWSRPANAQEVCPGGAGGLE